MGSLQFNEFHGILAHELGHNLGLGHANQCHQSIMNQSGSSPRNYLFNNQIGRMHKMISTTNTRQYVLGCPVDDDTLFVSSNQVWSEDLKIYKEYIIIESGNTLTLDCHIQMPEGGTIIVQPNAQLILDSGVITNTKDGNCNNLWQGIEVWGLSSYHQYKIGNFRFQGYVELKNNAIIENAITAISLGKGGDWQMENTGGVVEANNAIFKNNKRDIEFLQYQNHEPSDPNTPRPNLSYFKNCSFITDAPLADNQTPTSHVTMWNVDGVRFYGCTFENTNPSPPVGTLGKGIYTIDAHFNVTGCDWDSYCVPIGACCNKSANLFKDLEIGIHATYSSGSQYNYNVDNNIFENCMTNISNDGVNNAIITRNDHTIGFPRHSAWWTTGVYFNTGTGYRIEENTFDLALNPHIAVQVGTWLTNTGENNNQVYKNTFNDLSHGNLAYLNNRSSGSSATGLAYFCNTHINSDMHDILVDASHPDLGGIRSFQVTSESNVLLDAGNEFSHTGNNPESDFSNSSPNSILYFYYTPPATKEPIYYSSNNINLFQLTGAQHNHSCPSLFSSSPKSLSQENIENYQNLFQYHNEKYLDNLALLNSFLDGGNTESLIEDINHANELDMWSLHNNLTEYSPFLTNNVLKSIVDRQDIFPNSLIYDVLKSNPDEIRKGKILNYLSESEHHLSTWMIDSLEEESNNFTSRTSLESKVSFHRSKKDLYATLIAQDILEKKYRSEENHELNSNEYRNWIATYQTVHGAYQIVDDYFSQKEFSEGLNYFENISESYELNEFEFQEYNDLKKLFTIISTVNLSERNIYLLTEEEENNLRDLANNGIGIARVRACNILSFVYGEECEFVKEFPSSKDLKLRKKHDSDFRNLEVNLNVKIYPNPAKNYLELAYDLPLENSVYNVTIVDILGKTHYQDKIQNQKGQIAIDTRMWNNGVYLIHIQSNSNSAIFTDKFLISK